MQKVSAFDWKPHNSKLRAIIRDRKYIALIERLLKTTVGAPSKPVRAHVSSYGYDLKIGLSCQA